MMTETQFAILTTRVLLGKADDAEIAQYEKLRAPAPTPSPAAEKPKTAEELAEAGRAFVLAYGRAR